MKLQAFALPGRVEAGCDEAGRGCLAGPVFAAAVILPPDFEDELLNDSKKMTEAQRNKLRVRIEAEAVAWAVARVDEVEIDQINILNASIKAMHLALDKLTENPDFVLVDGNRFKPWSGAAHECIVKGDGKFASIAAASVLAKTHRDEFMEAQHELFPAYNWKQNKGYPTKAHRAAIEQHGPCELHRKSFRLTDTQLKFDF